MYKKLELCRVCGSSELSVALSLGDQFLTGVFPTDIEEKITKGPLDLVWCKNCELLQLSHSYSLEEMYGDNYGYRSGLNAGMVKHLSEKISNLENLVKPMATDLVIDIGSNDATSLKAYKGLFTKVGIDPTGSKFKEFYTEEIELIADFFSADVYEKTFKDRKAKIITSIAMFYDLESPLDFVRDIARVLHADGVWHFEQSYMPSMLRTNSYDTICHEHLEFYSLTVVDRILNECGLKVVDVKMNSVNGGSFAVTAAHKESSVMVNEAVIAWTLRQEKRMALNTLSPYIEFEKRVKEHRVALKDLIESLVSDGKKVFGYGASTKGNVLLQYCNLGPELIPCIAEVNVEKFGSFTPGTNIPIVSEDDARSQSPDYFLVLPWHFKHGILERERDFIANGGKFIFPLPEIEII